MCNQTCFKKKTHTHTHTHTHCCIHTYLSKHLDDRVVRVWYRQALEHLHQEPRDQRLVGVLHSTPRQGADDVHMLVIQINRALQGSQVLAEQRQLPQPLGIFRNVSILSQSRSSGRIPISISISTHVPQIDTQHDNKLLSDLAVPSGEQPVATLLGVRVVHTQHSSVCVVSVHECGHLLHQQLLGVGNVDTVVGRGDSGAPGVGRAPEAQSSLGWLGVEYGSKGELALVAVPNEFGRLLDGVDEDAVVLGIILVVAEFPGTSGVFVRGLQSQSLHPVGVDHLGQVASALVLGVLLAIRVVALLDSPDYLIEALLVHVVGLLLQLLGIGNVPPRAGRIPGRWSRENRYWGWDRGRNIFRYRYRYRF